VTVPFLDRQSSLAFYRDGLGLEMEDDEETSTQRITLGLAGGSSTRIVLEPPTAGRSVTDEERRMVLGLMDKGCLAHLTLSTTDLDGTFARLEASGAEVLQEPIRWSSSVRDCVFLDPAGTPVRIVEQHDVHQDQQHREG
jgi:predicted enzyme related to lactoylglutathione lyase